MLCFCSKYGRSIILCSISTDPLLASPSFSAIHFSGSERRALTLQLDEFAPCY